jgi:hypothetical protein
MKAIAKLTWRLSRFEIVALALASAVVTAAAAVVAPQLQGLALPSQCQALITGGYGPSDSARCPGLDQFMSLNATAGLILAAASVLPFVVGALLGSQVVARDIDNRSAQLAWWLSTSRLRWLVERVVPLGLLTVVLLVPPAVATTMLEGARNPQVEVWHSFVDFGLWGPLFITSAVAVLALGILAGSVLGRVLPSLLVSVAAAALLYIALPTLAMLPQSPAVYASGQPLVPGSISVSGGWRDANGTILSTQDALANAPADLDPALRYDWLGQHYQSVGLAIPGDRALLVAITEAALAATIALAAFGATAVVVVRRRPY